MRPPLPSPRTVTVVSPPDRRTAGAAAGRPWLATECAMPAITLPTSRASPSSASPSSTGVTPSACASLAAASRLSCGAAISRVSARARRGSPGLGVSAAGECQMPAHAVGQLDAVAGEDRRGIGRRGRVGHGRAAGDHRRVVAGHVGDQQRDGARGEGRRGEPAALDAREVLAHAVHLVDRGARAQQRPVDALLVGEREALGRQGEQGGAAARDQGQDQVVLAQAADQVEDARGRGPARLVGHGVGGLDHLDPLARGAVAVAGDDQARTARPASAAPAPAPSRPRPCRRRPRWSARAAARAGAPAARPQGRRRRPPRRTARAGTPAAPPG